MRSKGKRVVESFNCAIEGIIGVLKSESNMKVHFFATIIVILTALFAKLSKTEIAILTFSMAWVWITEIINTAIEKCVDLIIKEYNETAKFVKDAAAGSVFVAVANAIIVGYLVFYNKFEDSVGLIIGKIKNSMIHTSVIALILVVTIVLGLKAYFRKGRPLRGGMPSGHSAVAFSVWSSVFFISTNVYVITMTLLLALLVAQTRVKAGIHTFKEVLVGAIIGGGLTYILLYFSQTVGK